MNPVLTIDPEFEAKCPPLTEDELSQLEENILEEGLVLMPLIVWNDTIVDGHNRYRIAQAHPGIEFRTHEKQFNNRYEALSWICKNQLGRRNLTPQQKKYLIGQRYDAEKKTHGGDRKSNLPESSGQNDHLIAAQKTRERIASETGTSESYVKRADQYAKGVDAAEEVLPGIKNDLLLGKFKPRETDVAAVARASPEERREKAEQLRVIPEKKPKADKESARSGTKRRQEVYATIDKSYEDMKDSKRVTEDSALVSLRYTARNMVETCDVLFTNFPGLLEKPDYKDQVIEIMQEPKQYILKLEGEIDNDSMKTLYKLMEVSSRDLEIPDAYQRKLNAERVAKIVAGFNERIANEPKVSFRDGHYYVFDGQHTIVARKHMNGNNDLPILCKVYYGMTEAEEALLFAMQTGCSAALTPSARLRANLRGEDKASGEFYEATEEAGLHVGFERGGGTGRILCINTAFAEFKRVGAEIYKEALTILLEAWGGDPDSLRAEVIQGIVHFVELYNGEYDRERLIYSLRSYEPKFIYAAGKAEKELRGVKRYVNLFYRIYNGRRKHEILPMKF